MDAFSFFCQTKLQFGAGILSELGTQLKALSYSSYLVISGSSKTRASAGFAELIRTLEAMGLAYSVFDSVRPDPDAEMVRAAAAQITRHRHNAVIAYGGGSPIDCAKSAALMASNSVDILEFVLTRQTPQKPALPIIAIPTTAGTGSEMSAAAVTTDTKTRRKIGLSLPSYFPVLSLVDPELHISLPPDVTAATGMDALTHVLESYFSLGSNPVSDSINQTAIRLICANLVTAFSEPDNIESRSAMAYASSTAGMAFSNTGLGMVHGFAHPLGAQHCIAHGTANAVMLPYVLAAMKNEISGKIQNLSHYSVNVRSAEIQLDCVNNLIESILELRGVLGIPSSLQELGLAKTDLAPIHEDACTYRMRPRSPRKFSDAELFSILEAAWAGDIKKAASI